MVLDAALSFLHFTLLLILVSSLGAQAFMLRLPVSAPGLKLLAHADMFYGLSAMGLIAAGFARVYFGVGDESYYLSNHVFWAKIATFALVGLISILPTRAFIKWARAAKADAGFAPPEAERKRVRAMVMAELHLLALIVLFAVLMARGIG
jgi:putative membrane protein